ncbi:MAG: hypothetical protein IJ489_03375 [Clostridia bacterium]|nr:hypothetical protein [Clostridia bacterium]
MKNFFSLLLILSLVFLTACANTDNPETTTERSHETTKTTSTSEQTTETSEQTTETTSEKKYLFETEIRETTPIRTESPELQEKIDRNQENFPWIANKIVIEVGDQRDVPYIQQGHYGEYFDEKYQHPWVWMGGGTDGLVHTSQKKLDEEDLPVFRISKGDTLRIYKNDVPQEKFGLTVLDYSENENDPQNHHYADFSALCEEWGSGTYYVYTQIRCEGDYILVNGIFDENYTEYADFLVFFILEIE